MNLQVCTMRFFNPGDWFSFFLHQAWRGEDNWTSAWRTMMEPDRIDTELSRMRALGKFLP